MVLIITCMSVALWLLHKKISDAVVDLELLVCLFVNRSAMFVEAVFKSTFGFSYVLFVTVVTLYHVDNVFGVSFKKSNEVDNRKILRDVYRFNRFQSWYHSRTTEEHQEKSGEIKRKQEKAITQSAIERTVNKLERKGFKCITSVACSLFYLATTCHLLLLQTLCSFSLVLGVVGVQCVFNADQRSWST